MSTYVMSDIHGCYTAMNKMLEKIEFSKDDKLIIDGDIIDRGPENYEMLEWMMTASDNVEFLMGNHEEGFIQYVDTLRTCMNGSLGIKEAYCEARRDILGGFDLYGTIRKLLNRYNIGIGQFIYWSDKMRGFPYKKELAFNGRDYIIVHAGYITEEAAKKMNLQIYGSNTVEYFYTNAREESFNIGGREHATIVAGHNPTLVENEPFCNNGWVKRKEDIERDCIFYYIDCGCVFRKKNEKAHLACIRLEDEKIFYV